MGMGIKGGCFGYGRWAMAWAHLPRLLWIGSSVLVLEWLVVSGEGGESEGWL